MADVRMRWVARVVGLTWALAPATALAQGTPQHTSPPSTPSVKAQPWQVKGRVLTVRGDPIPGAEVEIKAGGAVNASRIAETDAVGEFGEAYPGPAGRSARIEVSLAASQAGYADAYDVIELDSSHRAVSVDLVLRQEVDDPHLLPLDTLTSALLPRLRRPATGAGIAGVDLAHFELALRMVDRGSSEDAAPILVGVAAHDSGCIECRTLAGLTRLESGGWSSAAGDLTAAAHLAVSAQGKGRMPEPFVALGVLETWRGDFAKAEVSFLHALEIDRKDALALQELGRAFLLQKRFSTADVYLQRAIAAGVGPDAHLLRAQSLLALGHNDKAKEEMTAFLGNRKPKQLSTGMRALWSELNVRADLEARQVAATLVDLSPAELVAAEPELTSLEPARDQSALPNILRKVGDNVAAIFRGLPDTSSVEELDMERLHADGKVVDSQQQDFRYLMVSLPDQPGPYFREYRADRSGRPTTPLTGEGRFVLTNGFASEPLMFHPDFQEGCAFRLVGTERLDRADALVIAFAEQPSRAKLLEGFVINHQSTVVLVQGLAWVNPATYQILRMRTDLLKPAPEIKLERQTTDVRFGEVRFKGADKTLWMPREVAVTVYWNGKIYRNLHRYSDYTLFEVKTHEKIKAPKVPAPATDEQ